MTAQAFEALKTYDWGQDANLLKPIDEAVVKSHGDAAARADLETKLIAVLPTDATYDGKQYVCRKLMLIGGDASVPALAELLSDEKLSHMARYALERIPTPQAATALREALPKLPAPLKVGVIGSLGVRQDAESVAALAALLADNDAAVAKAAAYALGDIQSDAAVKALAGDANAAAKAAVTDASLACAENLLRTGNKAGALAIYKKYAGGDQPKHVRLAATRGMLASAGK